MVKKSNNPKVDVNRVRKNMHIDGPVKYRKPTYSKVEPVMKFNLGEPVKVTNRNKVPASDVPLMEDTMLLIDGTCNIAMKNSGKPYCRKALAKQAEIINEAVGPLLYEMSQSNTRQKQIFRKYVLIHLNKGFYKNECVLVTIQRNVEKYPNRIWEVLEPTVGFSIILRFGHYNNDYKTIALDELPFYAYFYEYPYSHLSLLNSGLKFDTLIARKIYEFYGKKYNQRLGWVDQTRPMRTNAKTQNAPNNTITYSKDESLHWNGKVYNTTKNGKMFNFVFVNGMQRLKTNYIMSNEPYGFPVMVPAANTFTLIRMQEELLADKFRRNTIHAANIVELYLADPTTSNIVK